MDAIRRSASFGWWALLTFLTLGMVLEAMHGFKIGWYLDVTNEARRLQWTLAHTHGTLIALVNIVFAMYARSLATTGGEVPGTFLLASRCLRWAGISMPAGFFLGGLFTLGPDPGFAIALVPIGGVLLFAGVFLTARAAVAFREPEESEPRRPSEKKASQGKDR